MKIQFQHPLNVFAGFDPSDVSHYSNLNVPGITYMECRTSSPCRLQS